MNNEFGGDTGIDADFEIVKKECEECNYIVHEHKDEEHPEVFTHHSGLKVCGECAMKLDEENYG
jgi:hypothetical protein